MADPTVNARPSSADAKTQAEHLVSAPGRYLLHGASFEVIVTHAAAVNNVYTALMAGKNVSSENGAVTVLHNDHGDRWVQAPATAAQLDADTRRQIAESRFELGDLVDYDARTVTSPDGPKHVPGGRGHIRDVWADQGHALARIELEDGTFDVPPLEALRPA
ncbi:hypothetical protein [Streptomyces sp. NPDC048489]|uniref:hypothetical protein n=1 Tax=Streptomyces sp. NPDC048489 TaxID=3154504 RepID=UPI00342D1657